jgi:hypothetical protein
VSFGASRRSIGRGTLVFECAAAFGNNRGKMQPGAARLGAGIQTGRRCNRSMPQHATHLVMAGPRIEEDFASSVPKQMGVEL